MPYNKLTIYYFSGTGNAKRVSEWFASEEIKEGLEVTVQDLSKMKGQPVPAPQQGELIGICSPTHGFNFPPITLKFLFKFPRGKGRVFIMNTRAGMKLYKLHLPGLTGIAQLFAALIFLLKGYKVVGMRPVDLPSNWISIHPGLRQKVVVSMHRRCERNVRKFAKRILSGRTGYRALLDIIQDLAISPIALGYYFVGRFVIAKSFIATSKCTMCKLCINSCPVNAIKVIDNRPYWTFKCESCMKCMNTCPERAIQTAHGLVVGSLYLLFTVGMEYLWFFTVDQIKESFIKDFLQHGTTEFLIASALCIPFLWMAYRLVHYLMRYRWFEWIVVHTSLTFYRWWRRYKGIRSS